MLGNKVRFTVSPDTRFNYVAYIVHKLAGPRLSQMFVDYRERLDILCAGATSVLLFRFCENCVIVSSCELKASVAAPITLTTF